MKICRLTILGFALSIMLLDTLWTTTVHASSPESETENIAPEEQKLTPEEVKAWMDENQIEYTVKPERVNTHRPTRAELEDLFLNNNISSQNPKSLSWNEDNFSDSLSDLALASGDQWQSHSCHPQGSAFLKMGGQTLTGIRDGGLYYFDHRREYFRANDPTPRTYTVTEGPDGELSDAQSLSGGQLGYGRYSISVVYDVEYCLLGVCGIQQSDVEITCIFEAN